MINARICVNNQYSSNNPLLLEECDTNRLKIILNDEISQIIDYYDLQDLKNIKKVASGQSVLVYSVCWNDSSKFAIKKFIKSSEKEVIINKVYY